MTLSDMKLSKTAKDGLSSMPHQFVLNGHTFFTDSCCAFRYHGIVDGIFDSSPFSNSFDSSVGGLFDLEDRGFDYALSPVQPTLDMLKGKKRFLFGRSRQLVNSRYLRKVFLVLGKSASFYLAKSPLHPVFVTQDVADSSGTWSAILMPIRYDIHAPVDESVL